MSDTNCIEDARDPKVQEGPKSELHLDDHHVLEDTENSGMENKSYLPCPEQEEETIKKKYGGLLRKKHQLISKDHDHAFFDSADWALGKQGAQKSKGPLEELRPKLQPTPHQQLGLRRLAYASPDDGEGDISDGKHTSEDPGKTMDIDDGIDNADYPEDKSHESKS